MSGATGRPLAAASLPDATSARITDEQWRSLAARRVFFGHQSVGANLMDGLADILAEQPGTGMRLSETRDASRLSEPGIHHAALGQNGNPQSKLDEFVGLVGSAAPGPMVALVKLCYVDVTPESDPAEMFHAYRLTMERLKRERPDVTLVHVTVPLTADRGDWFHLKTLLRGKAGRSDRRLNLKRHRYNQLMRSTYGGRAPLFDLARAEAMGRDGRDVSVRHGGVDVPVLAREWTYDGGHLNPAGRKRAAWSLLGTLTALAD